MHLGARWRELIMTHPEAHKTDVADLHLPLTTEEAIIESAKNTSTYCEDPQISIWNCEIFRLVAGEGYSG